MDAFREVEHAPIQETNHQFEANGQESKSQEMATGPKLAKYRYAPEEFLAFFPGSQTPPLPLAELRERFPEFYVDEGQQPTSAEPFSAVEQRLYLSESQARSYYPLCEPGNNAPRQSEFVQKKPVMVTGLGRGTRFSNAPAPSFSTLVTGVGRGRWLPSVGTPGSVAMPGFDSTVPSESTVAMEPPKPEPPPVPPSVQALGPAQCVSPVASSKASSSRKGPSPSAQQRWCYLDPKGEEQGPFPSSDMADWFALGYFPIDVKFRQEQDTEFVALGDLIKSRGFPFFDGKNSTAQPTPAARSPAASVNTTSEDEMIAVPATSSKNSSPMVAPPTPPALSIVNSMTADNSLEELSGLQKDSDSKSALRRALAVTSEVTSGRSSSMGSEMASIFEQNQEEEHEHRDLERFDHELRARLAFLAEKRKQDEQRKLEEEHQKRLTEEAERQRLQAAQEEREKQLKELQERIRAEEEEIARRIEEEARRAENEELRQRRLAIEKERRLEEQRKKEQEEKQRMARVMAEEQRLRKLREEGGHIEVVPVKPASWAARNRQPPLQQTPFEISVATASGGQSLREIQMEEERQARAEKRQELQLSKQKRAVGTTEPPSGPWKKNNVNPSGESEGLWAIDLTPDDRSDAVSNSGSSSNMLSGPLTKWALKQIRALNPDVDGMIILERLNEVTSPRDAETIVTSYFGDCRPTREFLQAYLQKRNLLPSKGAHTGTSQNRAAGRPPKKMNKATKVVVDGATLGFRCISDPNRVNAGEIERMG